MARADVMGILAAVTITISTPAGAQDAAAAPKDESVAGMYLALDMDVLRPSKHFRDVIGRPIGLGGHLAVPFAYRGPVALALRLDGFWVRHDSEEQQYAVELAREFGGGLIGLQLATSRGWLRPYITGATGTTLYYTIERFEDCRFSECEPESDIRRSDWEGTMSFGTGVHFAILPPGPADTFQLQVHLGVTTRLGGTPDIRALADAPAGSRPRAHYRVWHVGVSIGGR